VWENPIKNPSFATTTDWTITGGTTFNTTVGAGEITQTGLCDGGAITQTIAMPLLRNTEPMVLKFRARKSATANSGTNAIGVFVNGTLYPVNISGSTTWANNVVCLGQLGYGGSVTIKFERLFAPTSCAFDPIQVDDVSIEPASVQSPVTSCPTLGTVANGEFTAATGWTYTATSGTPAVGTTINTTTGIATVSGTACSGTTLAGTVSIPSTATAPNAALAVKYSLSGTGSATAVRLSISLQGQNIATLPLRATAGTVDVCIPRWARGGVANLSLNFASKGGGTCTDTFNGTVDSVLVTTDTVCADNALYDGGFESATIADNGTWFLSSAGTYNPAPAITTNTLLAHGGSKYATMAMEYPCSGSTISQFGTVPAPITKGTTAGPALRYWWYLPSVTKATFQSCIGGSNCTTLAVNTKWTQAVTCLNPNLAGHPLEVRFIGNGGGGVCATAFTSESAWFDDVELTTDTSCPAQ
jgi:hypothetical protein